MSDATDFETNRDRARELLADDDLTALHLGVIRDDDTVDTVVARAGGESDESLQALSLLATHIRAVATEAGVEYDAVAADAAAIAGQLDEVSVDAMNEASEDSENEAEDSADD